MAETQTDLPLRLDVFDEAGTKVAERFWEGCHATTILPSTWTT